MPKGANSEQAFIQLDKTQKVMLTIALLFELLLLLFFNAMVKAVGSNITSDLGDATLFGFMNTIFFVASTSMMPIATKIGDKFGRKPIISFGVALYTLSLLVAGTTHSMVIHLAARAMQGLGQGCMLANSLAFLGEINSSSERARALGWYSIITGVTNIVGPILGGIITDALNWRYTCFSVLPFGIVCLVLFLKFMPHVVINADTKIDILGAIDITIAVSSIVVYTSFGGRYGYTSTFGITMIVLFLVSFIAIFPIERRAASPCIDFSVLKDRRFAITVLAVVFLAPAMYSTGSYVANYGQAVKGLSSTVAASFTSLNSVGLLAMGVFYTWISAKVNIKSICIADAFLYICNMLLMMSLGVESSMPLIIFTVLLQGARTSIYMPAFTTSLQNDMPPERTGTATSTIQFFQGLVGTIGISCMSMILNNTFQANCANVIPAELLNYVEEADVSKFVSASYLMSNMAGELADYRATLPEAAQGLFDTLIMNVRDAYAGGLATAYQVLLVLCVVGFVCCILMRLWDKKPEKV